jgi:hypothetical protein
MKKKLSLTDPTAKRNEGVSTDPTSVTTPTPAFSATNDDIKAIVQQYIIENLTISVKDGGFTDPNSRTIELKLDGQVICREYINIVSRREYEG